MRKKLWGGREAFSMQRKVSVCVCVNAQVGQLSSIAAVWDSYLFTAFCVGSERYNTHTNPLKRWLPSSRRPSHAQAIVQSQ